MNILGLGIYGILVVLVLLFLICKSTNLLGKLQHNVIINLIIEVLIGITIAEILSSILF